MFNYKEDNEFCIKQLCSEKGISFIERGNTLIINDLTVNKLLNSVHNSKNNFYKRFKDRESLYFYCSNQLKK